MNIQPLHEFILVRPVKLEARVGNIYISDKIKERDLKLAEVVKVGPGRDLEMGKPSTMHVKEGNIVIYTPDAHRVSLDGSTVVTNGLLPSGLVFLHVNNVIGIIGAENEDEANRLRTMLLDADDETLLEGDAEDRAITKELAWEEAGAQ